MELLTGYEGLAFGTTGNVESDLLAITSVHPMREDAVRTLLAENASDWSLVERLLNECALAEIDYRTKRFYVRRFRRTDGGHAHGSQAQDPTRG